MMETEDTGRIHVIFSCLVLAMLLVWVISGGFRSFASNMAEEAFWYVHSRFTHHPRLYNSKFYFFKIPYILMLFGAGLPIFFLEMALGQYAGVGPIKIFGRIAPILQGLGYVSLLLKVVISLKQIYLFLSFKKRLWSVLVCSLHFSTMLLSHGVSGTWLSLSVRYYCQELVWNGSIATILTIRNVAVQLLMNHRQQCIVRQAI